MAKDEVADLRQRVEALQEHWTEKKLNWLIPRRRLDLPTLCLAVIGAAASIVIAGAFVYPLARISYKYWLG